MERSSFLDMLGAPKTDLGKKQKCKLCGVVVTRKNFGMSSSSFDKGWTEPTVYCHDCFLKPEAISNP